VAGQARDLRRGRQFEHVAELTDLNGREWIVMGVLAFFVLLIGLWPAPLIEVMQTSVEALLQHVTTTKLIGIPG
jgi:NADH-quinone oxidoreductase subunit M